MIRTNALTNHRLLPCLKLSSKQGNSPHTRPRILCTFVSTSFLHTSSTWVPGNIPARTIPIGILRVRSFFGTLDGWLLGQNVRIRWLSGTVCIRCLDVNGALAVVTGRMWNVSCAQLLRWAVPIRSWMIFRAYP
jgi:hypothetical protein